MSLLSTTLKYTIRTCERKQVKLQYRTLHVGQVYLEICLRHLQARRRSVKISQNMDDVQWTHMLHDILDSGIASSSASRVWNSEVVVILDDDPEDEGVRRTGGGQMTSRCKFRKTQGITTYHLAADLQHGRFSSG